MNQVVDWNVRGTSIRIVSPVLPAGRHRKAILGRRGGWLEAQLFSAEGDSVLFTLVDLEKRDDVVWRREFVDLSGRLRCVFPKSHLELGCAYVFSASLFSQDALVDAASRGIYYGDVVVGFY